MLTTLADAWHTVAPPLGDRHGPLRRLLLVLTVVTGLVDAFSYLVLGHVFVANMTGNVVFLAFALVGAKGFSIGASFLALVAFVVGARHQRSGRHPSGSGAVAGCWPLPRLRGHAGDRGRGGRVGVGRAGPRVHPLPADRVARPGRRHAERHRPQAGRARPDHHRADHDHRRRRLREPTGGRPGSSIGRRGLSPLAMFTGALVGAAIVVHGRKPFGLLIAAVLLVVVAVMVWTSSRDQPVWDRRTEDGPQLPGPVKMSLAERGADRGPGPAWPVRRGPRWWPGWSSGCRARLMTVPPLMNGEMQHRRRSGPRRARYSPGSAAAGPGVSLQQAEASARRRRCRPRRR